VEEHNANLIFSDETLPIFILNTSGGGEAAIHDIVSASPSSGKLFARMMPRDQYTSYQDAGSLYELSTDGTNNYKKIFDFDSPVNFVLSPDGTKIAYISDNSLVVRALDSGDEFSRMDMDAYKYDWITKISWAPDSKTILMNIAPGETSVTPVEPYAKTNGCYIVNIHEMTMNKLSDPLFQYSMELIPGFMTDPFSYSYFPRSNRLIGIARKYEDAYYVVELYSVDLEGSNLIEIPIGHNAAVWEVFISPNEQYIAYPCLQNVCVTHIQDNLSEVASQPITAEGGGDQEQTVIGWLEK
jgi:WD40 repeat protein